MSKHETFEAAVLGGVALLFAVAILCIAVAPSESRPGDAAAPAVAEKNRR